MAQWTMEPTGTKLGCSLAPGGFPPGFPSGAAVLLSKLPCRSAPEVILEKFHPQKVVSHWIDRGQGNPPGGGWASASTATAATGIPGVVQRVAGGIVRIAAWIIRAAARLSRGMPEALQPVRRSAATTTEMQNRTGASRLIEAGQWDVRLVDAQGKSAITPLRKLPDVPVPAMSKLVTLLLAAQLP